MKKLFVILLSFIAFRLQAQLTPCSTCSGGAPSSLSTGQISVKDFGAIGDGGSHPLSSVYSTLAAAQAIYPTAISLSDEIDLMAFQTAHDFASFGAGAGGFYAIGKVPAGRTVYAPSGKYVFNRGLNWGYGFVFESVNLLGEMSYVYDPNSSNMKGAVIIDTAKRGFAINMQGQRNSVIQGITIVGKNNATFGYAANMIAPSTYIDPTLPRAATARYSPYVGISIDAYSAVKPTDTTGGMVPYPDMVYPAGLGYNAATQWSRLQSSGVRLASNRITNFVLGVGTEVAGGDNNGDFTYFIDNAIYQCYIGASITHSQARLGQFVRDQIDQCYYCLDNASYGTGHGRMIAAENCHFSGYAVMNIPQSDFNGPMGFYNCYGESLYLLGTFGVDRSTASSLLFENCHWNFNHGDISNIPLAILTATARTKIIFKGGLIKTYPTAIVSNFGDVEFDGVTFFVQTALYQNFGFASSASFSDFIQQTGGIVITHGHKIMRGCRVTTEGALTPIVTANIPTGIGGDNNYAYMPLDGALSSNIINISMSGQKPRNGYLYRGQLYPNPTGGRLNASTVSVPYTKTNPTTNMVYYACEPGMAWVGSDGRILLTTTGTGNNDTATLLNGYQVSAGVATNYAVDTSALLSSSYDYLYPKFNRNVTDNALTATATAGNATLTNVQLFGVSATSTNMTNAISTSYMVYLYTCSDPAAPTSGWYGPFRVSSMDGTARTITFDRTVPVSGTVYFFNTSSY